MAASVSMANQPALRAAVTVLFEDGWCLSGSASCQVAARSTPPTSVDTWLQNNLFFAYRQTAYTERMMDVQPTSDQSVTKVELMCSGCAGQRVFFCNVNATRPVCCIEYTWLFEALVEQRVLWPTYPIMECWLSMKTK